MKLKESTFAIIAEKKDSISHKWFDEEVNNFSWNKGEYYHYNYGFKNWSRTLPKNYKHPIYTESEFEALLKAEQENEGVNLKELEDKLDNAISKETKQSLEEWLRTDHNPPPPQITISYNLALEYIAERLNVDKVIIKIEMP